MNQGTLQLKNDHFLKIGEDPCLTPRHY